MYYTASELVKEVIQWTKTLQRYTEVTHPSHQETYLVHISTIRTLPTLTPLQIAVEAAPCRKTPSEKRTHLGTYREPSLPPPERRPFVSAADHSHGHRIFRGNHVRRHRFCWRQMHRHQSVDALYWIRHDLYITTVRIEQHSMVSPPR